MMVRVGEVPARETPTQTSVAELPSMAYCWDSETSGGEIVLNCCQ